MFEKKLPHSEKQEDQFLLRQVALGCKQSFNQLYEKHWEHAYQSVYIRLKNREESKDIVQEIFTHIWLKRETVAIDNLPAYISVAARNRIFKFVSKQKNIHPFFRLLENIPAMYRETDANLLTKEFFEAYEAVINSLPPKKKMIFRLRFQEDLSTKDISQHLGVSIKTVQNQIGKAIAQLRITFFILLVISSMFLS